jgi:hypothetical protein
VDFSPGANASPPEFSARPPFASAVCHRKNFYAGMAEIAPFKRFGNIADASHIVST